MLCKVSSSERNLQNVILKSYFEKETHLLKQNFLIFDQEFGKYLRGHLNMLLKVKSFGYEILFFPAVTQPRGWFSWGGTCKGLGQHLQKQHFVQTNAFSCFMLISKFSQKEFKIFQRQTIN